MDGFPQPSAADLRQPDGPRTATVTIDAPDAIGQLAKGLGAGPFALVMIFASPLAQLAPLMREARNAFGGAPVMACTTAGELCASQGFVQGTLVAVAFPRALFRAEVLLIEHLDRLSPQALTRRLLHARSYLRHSAPDMPAEFACLLVDGLSRREDLLVGTLASGLGRMPLFGGSAGDGLDFLSAQVALDGRVFENAAILALVRSRGPVQVFSMNHIRPTEQRMVVTRANPDKRLVHRVNGEPAAPELARILGVPLEQLRPHTFTETPLVVRLAGAHHVRAIKEVLPDGSLEFFSAIDEGLVLTTAAPTSMVDHMRRELAALSSPRPPQLILACDCLLRRLEAENHQQTSAASQIMVAHHMAGFSTYGEQINGLHVNQTMTGVALYAAPDPEPCHQGPTA